MAENPTQLFGIDTVKPEESKVEPTEPTREDRAIEAILSGSIYKEKSDA